MQQAASDLVKDPEVPTGDGGCALGKDGLPLDPGCRGCSYARSLGRRYLPDGTDCFASPQHVPAYARQAYPTVPLRTECVDGKRTWLVPCVTRSVWTDWDVRFIIT